MSRPGSLIAVLTAALAFVGVNRAEATSLTFNLDCVLTTSGCTPSASYGTITLNDSPGNGDLLLTVDLAGTGEKFRDLEMNYSGGASQITSDDGQATLTPNGFTLSPYLGSFDLGYSGGQG